MRISSQQLQDLHVRPLDCGKLIGDVPAASASLNRFLHHATVIHISGKSCRIRDKSESLVQQSLALPHHQPTVGLESLGEC